MADEIMQTLNRSMRQEVMSSQGSNVFFLEMLKNTTSMKVHPAVAMSVLMFRATVMDDDWRLL